MRLIFKGNFVEGEHYIPGSIVRMDGRYRVRTHRGWEDTFAPVDFALFRDGRDGQDGRNGVDGRDGANGRDGVDGRAGENGERGKHGKPGEVIHTTRIVRRSENTEDATHPVNFPCDVGQAITANGVASMLDPHVVGIVTATGQYKTEGSIAFNGTPGAILYLDEFTPGLLTTTPPETGYIVVVARQLTADKADLEIAPPIRL